MADKSPVIVLPNDEARKTQLTRKLAEYKERVGSSYAPKLLMNAICKVMILDRLLCIGQVNTWDLSRELSVMYGSRFDLDAFNSACGVIEDYCKTGGQNAHGGTGLK